MTTEQSVIAAAETAPKGWANLAVCLISHTSSDTSVKRGDRSLWRSLLRRERHNTRSCYLKYLENTGEQNGTTRNFTERQDMVATWVTGLFQQKVRFASAGIVLDWGISTQPLGGHFLGRVVRVGFWCEKSGISHCLISITWALYLSFSSDTPRTELSPMWRIVCPSCRLRVISNICLVKFSFLLSEIMVMYQVVVFRRYLVSFLHSASLLWKWRTCLLIYKMAKSWWPCWKSCQDKSWYVYKRKKPP